MTQAQKFAFRTGKIPKEAARFSSTEITALAKIKGWTKCNETSHGRPIYRDPVNKVYISPDGDVHSGGALKAADTIEKLKSDKTRLGTYIVEIKNGAPSLVWIGK